MANSSTVNTSVLSSTFSMSTLSHSSTTQAPSDQSCSFDDAALRLPLAGLYSLFFLIGLVGNLFALWVFLFLQVSRNSVRVFLINCAVADLVLLVCLAFRIHYHMNGNEWVLGQTACRLVGNLFYMNMYISILLLGFISLDRYLRLNMSGRSRKCMSIKLWGQSWALCGVLWGMSLLGCVTMIVTAEDKEDTGKCFQFKHRSSNAKGKAYFNGLLVAAFWLIFLVLIVSYAKIALRLLKVSRDKPDLPNASRYQRTAKKSFFVLFVFTICFMPYHTFRPVYILSQLNKSLPCEYLQLVDRINEIMLVLSAFNSCLDPVMYFLLSGSVRKTAMQALGQRIGNLFAFQTEATYNSSTMEFRRSSVPIALPNNWNNNSVTPRASLYVVSAVEPKDVTTLLTNKD
ncbi:probable G-protein coupled receptor 34 [Synchiropus splendidus]|uniref:probable G-protein coupled receptor 34 n=1 Tax=Synchiropus splendidus TaxID=270530 RepID=UPI00237DF5E4|nr:probable G-protein coupled receptor 34 [Synchiropus splendidus]